MSERKMTQCQPEPLWNCKSSCPYFKYQPQCHDSILQQFYPFSSMDPSLKSRYQCLSQHLIAQTAYQNTNQSNVPQYAGKMYGLGWKSGYEEASKIGITGIAANVAKDPDRYCELQSHFPEQNTFIGKQFYSLSCPLFDE
ncbi:hypothetical protein VP01_459g1, partial [Puccinia sorghi]